MTVHRHSICIWCLLCLFVIFGQGCSQLLITDAENEQESHADWDAQRYYNRARSALDSRDYDYAIELYEALETRYPFGQYAEQSLVDISYAYYKSDQPDSALASIDRFLRLHPTHPHAAYMYYLKGIINFNRGIGFLDRFLPTDQSQRDPGAARTAQEDFELLVQKYPDSIYADDASQRIVALRTNLALYEINVGRYYLRRGAYVAAANRGNYVIENYQRTVAVPRALLLMVNAYNKMGRTDLAADAQRVFDLNYPDGVPPINPSRGPEDITVAERVWSFFKLDE